MNIFQNIDGTIGVDFLGSLHNLHNRSIKMFTCCQFLSKPRAIIRFLILGIIVCPACPHRIVSVPGFYCESFSTCFCFSCHPRWSRGLCTEHRFYLGINQGEILFLKIFIRHSVHFYCRTFWIQIWWLRVILAKTKGWRKRCQLHVHGLQTLTQSQPFMRTTVTVNLLRFKIIRANHREERAATRRVIHVDGWLQEVHARPLCSTELRFW